MPTPHVCVLRAPGTNCDLETAYAFEKCGAKAERTHLFRLLEEPRLLAASQILCIPGGFSYGDDVGAGVIFAGQLRGHLAEALGSFLTSDKLVLGICNGFQVLLKAGVLPGGGSQWQAGREIPDATLTWNDNGKYTARWVHLRCGETQNVFLKGIAELELPIAHAEGRLVARENAVIEDWHRRGQIALRYGRAGSQVGDAAAPGAELLPFPENPNGSMANIAGLSDPSGRVLGLMPHPERFIHGTQHPQWTRRRLPDEGQGMRIFRNAVAYFG